MLFCSGGGYDCVVIVQTTNCTFLMYWIISFGVIRSNFDKNYVRLTYIYKHFAQHLPNTATSKMGRFSVSEFKGLNS